MLARASHYLKLLPIVLLLIIASCGRSIKEAPEINPEFGNYISAFTAGVVSKKSEIIIQLANDYYKPIQIGDEVKEELFSFDPSIKGKAYWKDKKTIEFKPDELLDSDEIYDVDFHLAKLLEVPEEFSTFTFQFRTIKQDFRIKFDGLTPHDPKKPTKQKLGGKIITYDIADTNDVRQLVTATQDGEKLNIKWEHTNDRNHNFTIENISRKENRSHIFVKWDGRAIGSQTKDEKNLEIPALGDFKVMSVNVIQSPEQLVEVYFSDLLQETQDLTGIVTLQGINNITHNIEGNKLTVYPSVRLSGTRVMNINEGLKNFMGYKIGKEDKIDVHFQQLKPSVKLVGKGSILPNSQGLIFPFDAVNLSAVDVNITKIYENNIIQFLQVNDHIDGTRQLYRVGDKLPTQTVHLNTLNSEELKNEKRYYLDLSNYINVDPGAIYRVSLSFSKEYSTYVCENNPNADDDAALAHIDTEEEEDWHDLHDGSYRRGYWYYDDYYYDYYYDEDYYNNQDGNPCEDSYYTHRKASRNILASNLGMISKIGDDRKVHLIVNDMLTTKPMGDVAVEFYSYTNQLIGSGKTDSEGMLAMELRHKPFIAIAKSGKQRGYLKLDDGNSLSLSKFDVSGATAEKGIKGFIYGERGVWRPGDSIFVSFIMEDKDNLLPSSHPVRFELVNPRGQVVQRIVKNTSVNDFYDFRTATDKDAPTGNWLARISVGNRLFTEKLKVETVKPNRLKIYLDFSDKVLAKNCDTKANLSVKWLHGAVAKNLKTEVNVALRHTTTSFDKFRGYTFDDPLKDFYSEEVTVFNGNVDQNGEVSFEPNINITEAAPGMLKAYFNTRAFEESGNFSVDRFSVPYSPYESYVGVRLPETDLYQGALDSEEKNTIDIATVDHLGNPVSRDCLEVKVYTIEWRWWWDSYNENIASYISNKSITPIQKLTLKTKDGKGSFTLKENLPPWSRYLVHVKDPVSGHATGKIFYMQQRYWGNKSLGDDASMLVFSTDKEKYTVGQKAKIKFPSSSQGSALICLESGTKVIKKFWANTKNGETEVSFTVTEDMAPNVFVHISLLQPHYKTKNDLPIRMYGVIPIMVEDPQTHLKPLISMRDVLEPESTATIKVSEATGKPMTYTLALVDEGLLDLTRFKTPQPWNHFYAREALGVKTWDIYDLVLGAYGGELDRLLSIGGDGSNANGKAAKANRFEPMVKFVGPFKLKKGQTAAHKIDIPNYVGSVRVMVVAGEDGAYGNAERTVPVRKPLMVLGTLPRVVGPTETVVLPVNVFAMEKHVKNVKVEVKTNELFSIRGSKTKEITFNQPGDEVVNFELEVANSIGIGKVEIITTSGKEKATHTIELDVRASNPRVVDVIEAVIEPGKTWNTSFAFENIKGTNEGTLELSSLPPIDLKRRMNYLLRYPHGCIEQTTSSVFPQLFVNSVVELNGEQLATIETNIKAALQRLQLFQTQQGGFTYWPGGSEESEWGSNYGGHFILEAELKGYRLPENMKKKWINYQAKMARDWSFNPGSSNFHGAAHHNDLTQAYRLYTLALAGSPEIGAMNRLREMPKVSIPAKWRLAAAYSLIGQQEVATLLTRDIATSVEDYRELSHTFGSSTRDEAMILETLCLLDNRVKAASIARDIAKIMGNQNRWMSTQETAYCLLSISKYLDGNGSSNLMEFAYNIMDIDKGEKKTSRSIFQQEFSDKKIGESGNISVTNSGKSVMYAKLVLEGIPLAGKETEASNNLDMRVRYTDLKGQAINPEKIEQGTDFIAEVTLVNPGMKGNYKEMALTQIFPSGWEIRNVRMDNFSVIQNGAYDYQDIRDDRVYTYYGLPKNSRTTYRVMLNATYLGHFYMPTIATEAMYDNTIYARVPGKWVDVVEPGQLVNK